MSRHRSTACLLSIALALGVASVSPTAQAGVYGDALGKCLVSASTDADKQKLMAWIFSAIALNPPIAPYANISASQRDAIDREMASLFERLVGDDCASEAREAIKYEGDAAFGAAFQLLGQVAGQQMFVSPSVSSGSEAFLKHVDLDALGKKLELEDKAP